MTTIIYSNLTTFYFPIPKAGLDVVVSHTHGLHVGVDDSGAEEFETTVL